MPIQAASPPLHRLLGQTADAVAAVRAGRSLTEVLVACPAELRGGTQALSFTVLRLLGGAMAARALMAPKAPPPAVDALLVTALALLWPGESPPPYAEHTLVDQAVTAARARTPAAAKFVNAVLRRFLRERAALVAEVQRQPVAAHNHPLWWIERLRQDWPAQADALMAAANHHAPMVLRVNARRGTAADYQQRLLAVGRGATRVDDPALGGQALVLDQPCAVHQLPGFAEGDVSVQDLSAQRAAPLLLGGDQPGALPALAAGARMLDACAAPGGKTAHLLERADLDLLALDSDARRLARVQETLNRLQLPATPGGGTVRLLAADARQVASWWDGRPFDAILLDAPCTASGIVRRHPDVRWLRRADDVAALAAVQRELLDALWPLLAPGGRLLYATCSIFKAEGQQQIDAFLQRHAAQQPRLSAASPGHLLGVPDNPSSPVEAFTGDGFYYALIHKP
ncbi:MAG: 16S rRNA (cytosine(967)-C(5))-methyltransferase [Burkholderiales bacterium RIFCSPHIGHO2_12_FULL_69_20]|nr:MAG: 16S rRNA (cytosine(967)-C(5))-methyltransferase [Burkholderiales bacterium RIFCSPHIGHO2_12_FULL_69_20]